MGNRHLTFKDIVSFNIDNKNKYDNKALQFNDRVVLSRDRSDYEIVIYRLGSSKEWHNDDSYCLYSEYKRVYLTSKGLDTLIVVGPANIDDFDKLSGFNAEMIITHNDITKISWYNKMNLNSKLTSEDYENIELVFIFLNSKSIPNYMSKIYELINDQERKG